MKHSNLKITKKSKRRIKIIRINPPYSKNLNTNAGKAFLKLLKKHFPAIHILHKILNKNIVKIRYSSRKNINSVISSDNKNNLNLRTASFESNCWNKESRPIKGEYLTTQLVYRATVVNAVNEDLKKIHWPIR